MGACFMVRPADIAIEEVHHAQTRRVAEVHALLQEALGLGCVEDKSSFGATVSLATDNAVVPKIVCCSYRGQVIGVVVGAYLRNVRAGMVMYSGVTESFRGRGIYTDLRARLTALLSQQACLHSAEMRYVVSELDESNRLFGAYVGRWGAFVAPCEYEQPAAQGLVRKKLKLVLQPYANPDPPSIREIAGLVREIYERVYRLTDVPQRADFVRMVESLNVLA